MQTTVDLLRKPEGLEPLGEAAYDCIVNFLRKNKLTDVGGNLVFRAPSEWQGEFGKGSLLIVVYDGGNHKRAFSMDASLEERPRYKTYETMQAELGKLGLYMEECTGWYGAVYQ